MVLRAFDEIFEISCYSVMLENIGCASGTVEKNSITSRGPYRITEDHNNGSYSVQSFDNKQGVI